MQRFVISLITAFVITLPAMATMACPVPGGSATFDQYSPQAIGTLSGSITCTVGALTFSEFQFSSAAQGGAALITPFGVTVTPLNFPGNEGFSFDPGFSVSSNQKQDVTIEFLVTAPSGQPLTDLGINFNGASSGTGSTSFTETFCLAAFTGPSCVTPQLQVNDNSLSTQVDISPGQGMLFITKDFIASGGTDGAASISLVQNNYSHMAVPEPRYTGVLLFGLAALIFVARRKSTSAS